MRENNFFLMKNTYTHTKEGRKDKNALMGEIHKH